MEILTPARFIVLLDAKPPVLLSLRLMSWHREITRLQWRTLFAAQLGWMLDAMDVTLYSFALTAVKREFHLTSAVAGALAAAPLVTSALGGMLFGWLSDRYGRARALALVDSRVQRGHRPHRHRASLPNWCFWRALAGIGLGGEWAAGSVLVAETWPAEHRGKAIGLMQSAWAIGYMLAAILAAVVLPGWGWRPLFVLGLLPAAATIWMRRGIRRTAPLAHARPHHHRRRRDAFPPAAATHCVAGGVDVFQRAVWLLGFVHLAAGVSFEPGRARRRRAHHRAIVGMDHSPAGGRVPGLCQLRLLCRPFRTPAGIRHVRACHRRAGAGLWHCLAAEPRSCWRSARSIGYFGHGYFSVLGAMMAELFPEHVRATAQGFCYNIGRALAGLLR